MSGKKKSEHFEELNFWQPASDMFSALLMILLLVILLLGLYLVQIPEYDQKDPDAGNTYADGGGDHDEGETPEPTIFVWGPEGGDGGGGGNSEDPNYEDSYPSPTPTITPTPTPVPQTSGGGPGNGDGDDPDDTKAAVYVMMVDADTTRVIKEPNIQFELYGEDHALQILNTYYPERISFRSYVTTEDGVFYFPEKLELGSYELHELTEPEGYDPADNVAFYIDREYDWPEPFVVEVPVYPSRNVIRLHMMDAETVDPLEGGTFDVIAAEDVITNDGTLRYRKNQVVSEIVCDENGEGESGEVYLGHYLVRERIIPRYYIGQETDLETDVEKKTDEDPPSISVTSIRSRIRVSLKDELYPTKGIAGASFSVLAVGRGAPAEVVTTDASGNIVLDSLEKGTTYQIVQTGSQDNYILDKNIYTVQVGLDGRIDGENETALELYNHMIRVSIGITDGFSNVQVADVNLALFDASDTLVRTWTTSGAPLMFTNLEPGTYYIVKDGDTTARYDIRVEDTVEIQEINLQTSHLLRYLIIAAAAVLAVVLLIIVVILILRRRKKKRN